MLFVHCCNVMVYVVYCVANGKQEKVQACLVTLWLFIISCHSLYKTTLGSLCSWKPAWSLNKANLRDLIAATSLVISNWIQIVNFSARVTVKFDGWPRKTIGHLFYATSSFVHHFLPIGEFKLELQSGNAKFRSKSTIFLAVWPWNFMDDPQKQ